MGGGGGGEGEGYGCCVVLCYQCSFVCTGRTLQKEAKDAVLRILGGVENLLLAVINKGCSG